ncbi:hypothetical protein [Lactococcus petauri]|uniref:hypothetical protein n=1 Tax=Lactococcus petauri TaxID=1940789 RepID=UPI0018A9175C|nr:hypothetical protein [Lactococcus petauri]MDC0825481.1 hypothetical protein [Lactococcus petauri]
MKKITHSTGRIALLKDEPQKIKDITKSIIEACSNADLSYEQINTALYHADEVLYKKTLKTKI